MAAIRESSIYHGVLRAFNSGTYKARVTLKGSIHMSLSDISTSRAITSADMVPGRDVAVLIFDKTKAGDAVVIAVWT